MSRLVSSKTPLLLLCVVLFFCVIQFSYAQTDNKFQCIGPEEENIDCSTLFDQKCPSAHEILEAYCVDGQTCDDDIEPTECTDFRYLCETRETPEAETTTFEACIPSMTQFTLTTPPSEEEPIVTTYTFDRVVDCQATNYLGQTVATTGCTETETEPKPEAQVIYDPADADTETTSTTNPTECIPFGATSPEECPSDVANFKTDFVAQEKFCSGKSTTVDQVCTSELTVTKTGYSYTSSYGTCPTELAFECPVYKITCIDSYAVPTPEEEDSAVSFSMTADGDEDASEDGTEEEASIQEIDAAQCKKSTPTCPTCTLAGIPLITDFSIEAGFKVNCYSRVAKAVDPSDDESDDESDEEAPFISLADSEDEFDWELVIEPSDERYALCLRASDFTTETDPKNTLPENTCADITTCPHYKCQDKALEWSFAACYDNDADASDAECVLDEKFPVCTGTRSLIFECFQGNTKWTETPSEYSAQADETDPCAAQTIYPNPVLTQDCRPDEQCPIFSWTTDVMIDDETDSDHGEEETSSDAVITTNGHKLTAKLINVDLSTEKPWTLSVYQRVVTQDPETLKISYNYTKIDGLVQEEITTDTATVDVSFDTLPLDSYFVLRAEYDSYTLVEEDSSYDAETGEPVDIDNLAKFTLAQSEEEEVTEEDSFEAGKQKPGFEKLGKVVNQCRVLFRDNCDNRAQCVEDVNSETQESIFTCSCVQAFSGNTCSECTLAQADCANGSTLYVEPDSTDEPSEGDDQDETPVSNNFMAQVSAIEKAEEADKQCKCVCLKANSGGKCDCKAMYIRFDFKSELSTASTSQNPGITAAQQEIAIKKWLAAFVTEFTDDIKLAFALFDTHISDLAAPAVAPAQMTAQQETTRRNYLVLRVAACKATPAQQQMLLSALQQRIMLAQATTTQLSSDEINTSWEEYTKSVHNLPSADEAGGISSLSAAYDPSCTGSECAPDVTAETYDPSQGTAPVDGDDDSGLSGVAIFFIVIGVLMIIGAIIVVLVYCCCNRSANKRKQFGSGNGTNDYQGGSELDLT